MNRSIPIGMALISTCFMLSAVGAEAPREYPIEANPNVQRRIQGVIEIGTSDVPRSDKFAAMESLRPLVEEDPQTLIRQLLYFQHAHAGESDVDLEKRMLAQSIIHQLSIPPTEIAKAVIPYAFTENRHLQGEVQRLLTRVEGVPRHRTPDFSYYQSLLTANRKDPSQDLVRYMYERSPGQAVLTLEAVYRQPNGPDKLVLWAEHVVSDVIWKQQHSFLEEDQVEPQAVEQLEKLSSHEAWWARLYVAEILRQHPEFRTATIVKRLNEDDHPLVRQANRST